MLRDFSGNGARKRRGATSRISVEAPHQESAGRNGQTCVTASRAPVRVGLIGCGRVAQERHLPALESLSSAKVVAVADIDANRLEMVANRFQVVRRATDFRTLVDDPDIDALAVCVPAQRHVVVAIAALAAGKHLLIEKPLALDLEECDLLIEKAAKSISKVTVGFNLRWHRLLREAPRYDSARGPR